MIKKNKRIIDKSVLDNHIETYNYCELCGHSANECHHIVSRGSGGGDHNYNLISVCRTCHNSVHNGFYRYEQLVDLVSKREKVEPKVIYDFLSNMKRRNVNERV